MTRENHMQNQEYRRGNQMIEARSFYSYRITEQSSLQNNDIHIYQTLPPHRTQLAISNTIGLQNKVKSL